MSIVDRPPVVSPAYPRQTPVTLAMYDRMLDAGVFDPPELHPLELIGGELHMMSPVGDRHADAVAFLTRWSSAHADTSRMLVWVQNPLAIPVSESAPQPDIAWVTLRRYADRRPLARTEAALSPAELFLPG